jgi:hypothetical protein
MLISRSFATFGNQSEGFDTYNEFNWAQPANIVDSNNCSRTTQDIYDQTSTAQTLSIANPEIIIDTTPFTWNPQNETISAIGLDHTTLMYQDDTLYPHSSAIREILFNFVTPRLDIITPINDFLDGYFSSSKNRTIGLRGSIIRDPQNENILWPVLQWQEEADTEVLAIFDVEEGMYCNSLIHVGEGITFQPGGSRWRHRRVKWSVRDFERFKILFDVLLPAVGKEHWPDEEPEKQLFNSNIPEIDQYLPSRVSVN